MFELEMPVAHVLQNIFKHEISVFLYASTLYLEYIEYMAHRKISLDNNKKNILFLETLKNCHE